VLPLPFNTAERYTAWCCDWLANMLIMLPLMYIIISPSCVKIVCQDTFWPLTYSVSQKNPPWDHDIFHFFHKRLRICNRFFTQLLHVPIFARLQIFIQLYPTLTKLCHIKRDCLVHVMCSKYPPSAKMQAFRCLRKLWQLCWWLSVARHTRKPSYRWQTRATQKPAKIAPIRRAYNVVADNTGLSSCV